MKKITPINFLSFFVIALLLLFGTTAVNATGGGGGLLTTSGYLLPSSNAGSNITTVGIQYKPIIPSELFETGPVSFKDDFWNISMTPTLGHSWGMVIRKGFTDRYSLEVGINQVVRKYDIAASFGDTTYVGKSNFRFVGYEIPVQGLIYVRLGENVYMNNAFGVSVDMFAGDTQTSDEFIRVYTAASKWIQLGLIANVGFEFRTKKSGFFYLGGSLHRPFTRIAKSFYRFEPKGKEFDAEIPLIGNYLTIDFRYFFHEDAEKKQRKQGKRVKS